MTEVLERPEFQNRPEGLDPKHVRKLRASLGGLEPIEPISVAQVGKALYVVDGFHRLEAHRQDKREQIQAKVARMSLSEAEAHAKTVANTRHGKNLTREGKRKLWEAFLAAGRHLKADGTLKSPRAIAGELNGLYSHQTIRNLLRAAGLADELEAIGVSRWEQEEPTLQELEEEREAEAEMALQRFAAIVPTLQDEGIRGRLLHTARDWVDRLERGETLGADFGPRAAELDI